MHFTEQQFQICCMATPADANLYYSSVIQSLDTFDIRDRTEHAAFLSTIGHESLNLTKVEEGLYYKDAERLAKMFRRVFDLNKDKVISAYEVQEASKYTRNPAALAAKLYNNFQGRGLMQLTWEGNYRIIGDMVGFDYVGNPNLLLEPIHAALSAVAFWVYSGAGRVADDPEAVRRIINGPARAGLNDEPGSVGTRSRFALSLRTL